LPAACLASGILAGRFAGFGNRELILLITAFVSLAVLAGWGASPRLARLCALLAVFFSGAWLELFHRPGPRPVIETGPREILLLSGCVVDPPAFFPDRTRFVLELEPKARVRVTLYPRPGERPPELRYGQRVEVEGRLRKVRNYGNPGAFDIESYLARKHIYWTASVPAGSPVRVLPGECGSRVKRPIYALRSAMLSRIESLYADRPYETGMMQALLTGDKSNVEEPWTDAFRITGTYHALVISGLHLGVLAAVVVLLLRSCLLSEAAALFLATAFAWTYAVLVGGQAPVMRAATGLTLYACGRFLYRRTRPLNLLAAAAIVLLAADPGQLFEASFQLSFLSVAALGALALPLVERTSGPLRQGLAGITDRERDLTLPPLAAQFRVELRLAAQTLHLLTRLPERRLLQAAALGLRPLFYLYELAVVSACVQAGLILPMAIYFHRFSISGLTANLAVVPLMSLCVPVGMFAVFSGWRPAAETAAWLLRTAQGVVDWHAQRQPDWRIPDPPLWLAAALACGLLLLAVLLGAGSRWRWGAGVACGLLAALLVWYPFSPQVAPGRLELAALDVGQGDALFLALPEGRLVTVDAGGVPSYNNRAGGFDPGEDVVSPYLWSRRIKRLDAVVLSHLHEDHAGGAPALIRNFRPREVWTSGLGDSPVAQAVQAACRQTGSVLRLLRAGEVIEMGGARFQVLAPPAEHVPSTPADRDSLVLQVSYGAHSALLTGDLDPSVERYLTAQRLLPRSDILKVPHHGSRRSTGLPFLEQVRPSVALISAGVDNPYGHPHRDVLARLEQVQATALRTDVWGLIQLVTDGRRLELDTFRWRNGRARSSLRQF